MERKPSENFEQLTDAELHQKLLQYGFPNVPVTETSRGILVKKLKSHLKNTKGRRRWQSSKSLLYTSKLKGHHEDVLPSTSTTDEPICSAMVQGRSPLRPPGPVRESPATTNLLTYPLQRLRNIALNTAPSLPSRMRHTSFRSSESDSEPSYLTKLIKVFCIGENITSVVWWSLTMFFFLITVAYLMSTSAGYQQISENRTHYVACDKTDAVAPLTRPPYVCIDRDRLQSALSIIKSLQRVLRERSERHHCHDRKHPNNINAMEFIRHIVEEGRTADARSIEGAQYLITCNPQWNIGVLNAEGVPAIVNGVEKQLSNRHVYFVLTKPHLPLMCFLYLKIQRFLSLVSQLTLIAGVLVISFAVYRYIRRVQEQRETAVEMLTANIVDELKQRASGHDGVAPAEDRAVPVNHLRDELLPLRKRKSLLSAWNEAVKLLEENESRIRFAQSTHNGEEVRTMEWIEIGGIPVRDEETLC